MAILTAAAYDEAKTAKIIQLYKDGYLELLKIIDAKNMIGRSTAQKEALLIQVDRILQSIDKSTKEWVEKNIPEIYRHAADTAVKELAALGETVKYTAFSQLHQDAVKAIASDTYLQFANGLKVVKLTTMQTMDQITKQEIAAEFAKNVITGMTNKDLTKNVAGLLESKGIVSFLDKGGKSWQLDTYAAMLARTKAAEASRIGCENRTLENGFDLMQISVHSGVIDDCAHVEGKIYSVTGNTPGYPTLAQIKAQSRHIFGPNCKHRSAPYSPKYDPMSEEFKKASKSADPIERERLKKAGFSFPAEDDGAPVPKKSITKAPKPAKVLPKDITVEFNGKKETFKLSNFEAKFIQDKGVVVQGGRTAKTLHGTYTPAMNTITIKTLGKGSDSTFYHELGHAIDARTNPVREVEAKFGDIVTKRKAYDMLTKTDKFTSLPKEDMREVIYNRLINTHTANGSPITKEDAKTLFMGLTANNKRLPKSYIKYLRQYDEILADGYAQYRLKPGEFKKYAPDMFKYFEEITK